MSFDQINVVEIFLSLYLERNNPIRVPIRPEQSEGVCDQHGPGIKKIEGNKITFGDGYEAEFDVIVYCTGYKHVYPFLEKSLQLQCTSAYYLPHLYKGIVYQECKKLFYIGAQVTFVSKIKVYDVDQHLLEN